MKNGKQNINMALIPYLPYDEVLSIRKTLDKIRQSGALKNSDRNMLLTGESGTGKSDLVLRYLKLNPRQETLERDVSPVIYVRLEFSSTKDDLVQQVLEALGQPAGLCRKKGRELMYELKSRFNACRVELIFLDNVQSLIKNSSADFEDHIADWLNYLIDELGIPTVIIGKPIALSLVKRNDELSSRLGYRGHLTTFKVASENDRSRYESFLKKTSENMMFESGLTFVESELFYRIFAYTSGFARPTVGLLSEVAAIASSQEKKVSLAMFKEALANRGYSVENNYFSIQIDKLILKELSENPLWKHQSYHSHDPLLAPIYKSYKLSKDLKPVES